MNNSDRSPLIDLQGPLTEAILPSSAASGFAAEIRSAMRPEIFPGMFGDRIDLSETKLYVGKRRGMLGLSENTSSIEEQIAEFQLNSIDKVLILIGQEGNGKSTLLRHYFDAWRWNRKSDTDGGTSDTSVVLYSDLRTVRSQQHADESIFMDFAKQIKKSFPEITVHDRCQMWDYQANWVDPLHKSAAQSYTNLESYRAFFVGQMILDNSAFVQCAINYTSRVQD